jgi:SAM-dependent methyltransferase
MEQVTPMFQVITNFLPGVRCVGSEYLGPKQAPGSMVGHVRHEDAEALSFADATFDVVMSNDVLEHVPHPALALAESRRVLKPGGALFFSVPFYVHRDDSRPRAVLENGALNHLEAPEYHGNPVDPGGSLVFTDFGWDLIDTLHAAGFADAYAVVFWSLEHGHLGVRNLLFIAQC